MTDRKDKPKKEEASEKQEVAAQEEKAPSGEEAGSAPLEEGGGAGAVNAEAELEQLRQKWQRLAADYQNYQKRAERMMEQTAQTAQEGLVRELVPVLDNFAHTLEKGAESQDTGALKQGIQMVYDHLLKVLSRHGLKPIEVKAGMPFDPQFHEAVVQEESSEIAEQGIVRELGRGYVMNERTLRPAKVSVAKAPGQGEEEQSEGQS